MIKLTKRGKNVIAAVIFLYVIFTSQLNTRKLTDQFYKGFKTFVPSTTVSQELNLKKFVPEDIRSSSVAGLRSQLALQFPYDPSQPIPKRVWQTWKTAFDSADMPSDFRYYSQQWLEATKDASLYEYALIPDDHIMPLLRNLYGSVPQVIQAYEMLPLSILKADFFRYLILYARGGIYSDMDTYPLKSLDQWPSLSPASYHKSGVPVKYKGSDTTIAEEVPEPGFIAGIEADPDRPDWNIYYARRIQFCQWTIQSKPGHPLLRELVINITATTLASTHAKSGAGTPDFFIDDERRGDYFVNNRGNRRQDEKFPIEQKKTSKNTDGTDTMNWTGPGVFSDAIFNYVNNLIRTNAGIPIINKNLERNKRNGGKGTYQFYDTISKSLLSSATFPNEFFSLIEEPVFVDDVMILPITSFSPGVNHMGSKDEDDEMAFVRHRFKGSWKPESERGETEESEDTEKKD